MLPKRHPLALTMDVLAGATERVTLYELERRSKTNTKTLLHYTEYLEARALLEHDAEDKFLVTAKGRLLLELLDSPRITA